ncbi:polymerase I and transcript release factor [Liparis tanakae]|uniref:Polymerase I and transcript release factor n=1 Tax=Liparis tanakae TaxID=230148 RepID=A0A4Z2G7P0_9TELE|nr:polymerase I and transcript release factor [Liparis tanakae]
MAAMEALEFTSAQLEPHTLTEISDDEVNLPPSDDEDDADAFAAAKKEPSTAGTEGDVAAPDEAAVSAADKPDQQVNGVMVLTLLDKIIGAVDQIQQTQTGLEARQQDMERSVYGIQSELSKLAKSHSTTSNSVNKMMEKVRKVSVNVKTVRATLEKQGGQIKKLENNEAELLKRRNFKVMIYQQQSSILSSPRALTVSAHEFILACTIEVGVRVHNDVQLHPGSSEEGSKFILDPPLTISPRGLSPRCVIPMTCAISRPLGKPPPAGGRHVDRSSTSLVLSRFKPGADEVKVASKLSVSKSMKVSDAVSGSRGGSMLELKEAVEEEEGGEAEKADMPHIDLSSDEEGVEIEEILEETRAERIKRSSLQRVQTLKTVFSKEKIDKTRAKTKEKLEKTKQKTKDNLEKTKQKTKDNLEKTKQKTKDNLEKTRQKTKDNIEKTRHNIEMKMGKLGTQMTVNPERKQKMQTSREKVKKAFTPDHVVYARSQTASYKVPPFTFHVKKVREGIAEVVQGTEMVEVSQDLDAFEGVDVEVEEEVVEVEMEMMNGGGDEDEADDDEEEDNEDALQEKEDRDRDSD